MKLILASSSPYRRQLMERLGLPFEYESPNIDERRHDNEKALDLVKRLAIAKTAHIGQKHPNSLVIGSDQVALLGDLILTKPGTRDAACEQLNRQSGQTVDFLTAVVLLNTANYRQQSTVVTTSVEFRKLDTATIERYVDKELPLDCAGSFKSESLGICLFEQIVSSDPTALIGLPLISLVTMLTKEGIILP